MKRFIGMFHALPLLMVLAIVNASWAFEVRLPVGGVERRAIIVNPPSEGLKRPAVLVLHGGNGSAESQRQRTGFDQVAFREGFMVVYPEGTPWGGGRHAWNTGYLQRRQVGHADDIGFLDALIELLVDRHGADPARIYMTGGSNGGMMTFVYGVKRADRLAAIAPVVGAMFSFVDQPSRPLPILMINGAADAEVPIEGGMSRNQVVRSAQAAPFKPLNQTVSFWVTANRSRATPLVEIQGTITTRTYTASTGGAVTISLVDAVGGHGWPGTDPRRPGNTPIQGFQGAERIWLFFKEHQRH
ncbi:MAG: alpha/beta hydrolase family esterase [Betaproteobacteria bacterium]|jgi:polyhydroxybutyrate depolymerase